MRTVRVVLTMAMVLVLAAPLVAQQKQGKRRAGGRLSAPSRVLLRIERLHKAMEGLDLSDKQKEQLKAIHKEVGPQMKDAIEKLGAILTDEQKTVAKEAAAKAKEAGTEGAKFFREVEAAIKITDQQKKDAEEVGKKMASMQQAVTKKIMSVLTPDQKAELKKKLAPKGRKGGKKGGKKKSE